MYQFNVRVPPRYEENRAVCVARSRTDIQPTVGVAADWLDIAG